MSFCVIVIFHKVVYSKIAVFVEFDNANDDNDNDNNLLNINAATK